MKLIITELQLKKIISEQQDIINEDMVRLRTLTKKSIWNVTQKYRNMTVGEIMEVHPSTLYWGYCNVEWLDYTPDILEFLSQKFPKYFYHIDKPGLDKEQFKAFVERHSNFNYNNRTLPELKKLLQAKRINGEKVDLELINAINNKKMEYKKTMIRTNPSKAYMQNKNQGKI